MAHYAFIDDDNIVTEVIVGKDEGEDGIDWEAYYGEFRGQVCKRTSYNTRGGQHISGGTPFRKNYAGVGYTWDGVGFIPPKAYPSWVMNSFSYLWEAPVPMPEPNSPPFYEWDEATVSWVLAPDQPQPIPSTDNPGSAPDVIG